MVVNTDAAQVIRRDLSACSRGLRSRKTLQAALPYEVKLVSTSFINCFMTTSPVNTPANACA
jgi:hypothetical protein